MSFYQNITILAVSNRAYENYKELITYFLLHADGSKRDAVRIDV
jgi:hypothetical protein